MIVEIDCGVDVIEVVILYVDVCGECGGIDFVMSVVVGDYCLWCEVVVS